MSHKSFTTAQGDLIVRFTDSSGATTLMVYNQTDKTSTFIEFESMSELTEFMSALSA